MVKVSSEMLVIVNKVAPNSSSSLIWTTF